MAIPNRILEGINNSELKAEDYYSIYGKEVLNSALSELKQSDTEILSKYKPEAMHIAVEAKLNAKKGIIKIPSKVFRIATYAAAAVFIAAIAIPVGVTTINPANPTQDVRLKGPSSELPKNQKLVLYRKNGKEAEKLNNGNLVNEGDVIQITYQAGNNDYGIIFSIDGNGNITRHFPENNWTAQQLKHSKDEIPLDFSYELDNAPDYECFIMISSPKEFSLDDINERIKDKKNINYLRRLSYLPKNTNGTAFVLKK